MKLSSFTHSLPAAGHMSGGSVTNGFKFTGKETGYNGNSVFFPAQDGNSYYGDEYYWSATADGSEAWYMDLFCLDGNWRSIWSTLNQFNNYCLVRPVFKN